MERRLYSRVALKEPVACQCRIGDEEPVLGFVKNVGILGVMLEVPGLADRLTMECCQRVSLDEGETDNGHLFSGMVGTMNWVYKDFIGVAFEHAIKDSHEELILWLEEHDQVGDGQV